MSAEQIPVELVIPKLRPQFEIRHYRSGSSKKSPVLARGIRELLDAIVIAQALAKNYPDKSGQTTMAIWAHAVRIPPGRKYRKHEQVIPCSVECDPARWSSVADLLRVAANRLELWVREFAQTDRAVRWADLNFDGYGSARWQEVEKLPGFRDAFFRGDFDAAWETVTNPPTESAERTVAA